MRSLILVAMAMLALPCGAARADDLDQPEALFKSCPKGVLFKAFESGVVVTVIRQGFGEACFSDDCSHRQAATAAELVTKDGEHGFIAGPMLSYMFAVEPKIVKDFKWRPAETASTTFYTVRTDDGSDVDFTLQDIGCVR
ncbi:MULTISPECIES: hypothetical protein [unclassified Mesorhizobium]|uniref:hypothetical protein n=1 Tax=unclassified Mesorhizobium TaxID=325217 RepID=UPI0011296F16|nr:MULTISPECIES: hypothetical protein [unclassified Mesorhizobium]TPL00255.1 hypothetical protein FJ567_14970 [Mesorhizobium sp. B2-4-16]TPL66305.1 hypothetical protein FJ956_20075 [Mesorhizobium sp. B2-4-3]